jgi:formamidopyrimidine-DNA glycosylase
MPELPEVETIARYLRDGKDGKPLVGQTIHSAEVLWEKSIAKPGIEEFRQRVSGQSVRIIDRRGKFLVLRLDRDHLLFHLRMSGDLRMESEQAEDGQVRPFATHDRLVFHLMDGGRLVFNDPRKFGRAWLVADTSAVFDGLGPEPLADNFSAQDLYQRLQTHHRQLKPLLLDQKFIAGLGNIYTDEALHLARLHPNQISDGVSPQDADNLWHAIRTVLREGIRRNGASIDWVYRGGDFQNSFRVYQRTGLPCPVCGTAIVRMVVGQRGTHYCPACQPKPD